MADPVVLKNALVSFSTSTGSAVYTEVDANKSITFELNKAQLPNSVMGDSLETFHPGLTSVPISLVHRQDFTTAGIDKKLWTLWNNETAFRLKIRAVDSAVSSSNPSYILNKVRIFKIVPISGKHGDLLENAMDIRAGSGCTVTRSTST